MKHLTIKDIDPADYKYVIEKPDMTFSPEKNYQTITKVIKQTEEFFANEAKVLRDDRENRVDILSTYGRKRLSGETQKGFTEYMGREWMGKIIGERILSKLRVLESVERLNRTRGNTRFSKFVQL